VPAPYKYLQVAMLGPYILLAWINIANPKKVNEAVWSTRIIFIAVVLIVLGVGTFYLSTKESRNFKADNTTFYNAEGANASDKLMASLSAEIAKLREELKNNNSKKEEDSGLSGLINLIKS